MRPTLEQRFFSRVERTDGCWTFRSGARTRSGHRQIWVVDRMVLAHRVSWELHHGPILEGMVVCHRCDNPPCVNPAHLFLGTVAANNEDRDLKGRHVALPGSSNGNAKLSEYQVQEILAACADGEPQRAVAGRYGISQGLVSLIVRGKAWTHVARETAV